MTQIRKKWPKCCPSESSVGETVLNNSACSSVPDIVPPPNSQNEINESVSRLIEKIENLFNDLGQRIENLEKQFQDFLSQAKHQNEQYCNALEELKKLKEKFEQACPALEKLQAQKEQKLNSSKDNVNQKNCDIKVNIRRNGSSSADSTLTDEETDEEESSTMLEIRWLKDRVLDISESLKLQSRFLKRLKCEELEKIKQDVVKVNDMMLGVKCEVIDSREKISLAGHQNVVGMREELDKLRLELRKLNQHVGEVETKVETVRTEASDQFNSIKFNGEIHSKSSTASGDSELVHKENLDCESDSEFNGKYCDTPDCCADGNFHSCMPKCSHNHQGQNLATCCTLPQFNYCPASFAPKHCRTCESFKSKQAFQGNDSSTNLRDESFEPDFVESLCNLQKQITSHRSCLQQLISDLAMKLDRCEFEMCRHQLSETIDLVMKLREERACPPPIAAGGTIPFVRKINCLSCQSPATMKTFDSTVPMAPKLKFARTDCNPDNLRSQCQTISTSNWSCYNRSSGRRVAGSHTKIGKAIEVRQMRFKRLKTPIKIVSSIFVYKNRFRRSNNPNNCL